MSSVLLTSQLSEILHCLFYRFSATQHLTQCESLSSFYADVKVKSIDVFGFPPRPHAAVAQSAQIASCCTRSIVELTTLRGFDLEICPRLVFTAVCLPRDGVYTWQRMQGACSRPESATVTQLPRPRAWDKP